MKRSLFIILLVLIIDQALKVWIKTSFYLGEDLRITDWFIIHFTENPGMAFGLEWGGLWGKLGLSIFRLIAIIGITWWLRNLIRHNNPFLGILAVSLVLAGALGNLLDSAFYGLLFDRGLTFDTEAHQWLGYTGVAQLNGEGYAAPMLGNVVDMLYFPLYNGYLPDWIPFWGGDYFVFFRPIFNIADASITAGFVLMLLFQKRAFHKPEPRHIEP
ncbi:MAG: lipoprotein signal peptidase [Bacteroidota bacterium]|nr:lipoprotein signal peptidase [Bacteroidota bacterium]MDX5446825.1 lipoprotein signal peptidase [Bacteroidota bacterium]MDX5504818.1 lipoprotein signal peptidase [Bacteroidota bacterium]